MKSLIMAALALMPAAIAPALAQGPPDPKALKAEMVKADLFIAVTHHDLAGVRAALAKGADPNGRNWLEFTPLMWAAIRGDRNVVDELIAHKAQVTTTSIYGSALSFALTGRHPDIAGYLIDKGCDPNASRIDGLNPLMIASLNGDTAIVSKLLKLKCDPNKKDADGETALMHASKYGRVAAAQALLKHGAQVNEADSNGRTALMYAAMNGNADSVKLLLAHKASVNAKDKRYASAIHLASRYCGDPKVIQSLLQGGANATAADSAGRTPYDLCNTRGYEEAAAILKQKSAGASIRTAGYSSALSPKTAIQNSLQAIQGGMKAFADHAKCSSCHHQGLGLMALGAANKHGFHTDGKLMMTYLTRLGAEGKEMGPQVHMALQNPELVKLAQAVDINDFAIGMSYIFSGVSACGIPSNPGFNDLALILCTQQQPNGCWNYGIDREPIQSSYFTTTALALNVIHAYGPKDEKITTAVEKARKWLLATPTANAEDRASKLFGLKLAGATSDELQAAAKDLLAVQKADGGWSQLPSMRSDAYATGLAIYALRQGGGVTANDAAVQKGVSFLLRTQDEDGSWFVNKRAGAANTYFDSGFPHGESQFISFGATCWAAMALMEFQTKAETASK